MGKLKELIGFVGGRSYDVILLLAKALTCFGEKVLVVDRNIFHTLSAAIPVPEGLSPVRQVVAYDGFFYTESEQKEEALRDYDYVLYDFGMVPHRELERCTAVYMVSGCLPHHVRQVRELHVARDKVRGLIIRDLLKMNRREGKEIEALLAEYPNCRPKRLKQEYLDQKNCLVYETSYEYRLRDASAQMQELVYSLFDEVHPGISEKEFWQLIRKQERKGYL